MKAVPIDRISPQATRSCHDRVVAVDDNLVLAKAACARVNERGREIHIFHTGDDDPLQRMLNAMQPGSYVRPHRHLDTGKSEAVVLLRGSIGFMPFHDDGSIDEEHLVLLSRETGVLAFDCRPHVWHTFFALEPDTVVFETKNGPYTASTDKDFAPWAPAEGDPAAIAYLAGLEARLRAHFGL
jgi:cupin fold WbuC family metalloprotein